MLPREAFFADKERVALERAAGRVSAEQVVFYPPGIPVLCPGELVSRELIAYIRRMQGWDAGLWGRRMQSFAPSA